MGKERSGVVEGGSASEVKQKDQPNPSVAAYPLATTVIAKEKQRGKIRGLGKASRSVRSP